MEPVKLQSAKVLSSQEEKNIDQRIDSLKEIREGKEVVQGLNYEIKDTAAIDQRIAELERVKSMHGAPEISPKERDRAVAELKLLEEDLRKDMPTWDEYVSLTPKSGSRYTRLVQKIFKWETNPVRRQKIQRWKTLRRLLDREDPTAASTVHLFPQ